MRTRTLTVTLDVEYPPSNSADWRAARVVVAERGDGRSVPPAVINCGYYESLACRAATPVWRVRAGADPGLRAWAAGVLAGGGR